MPTIRALRIQKELPQFRLAELAGVSTPTIVRMETGKPVSKDSLEKVCAILEVSPTEVEGVNIFVPVRDRRLRRKNV